jgi:hypothetical protein
MRKPSGTLGADQQYLIPLLPNACKKTLFQAEQGFLAHDPDQDHFG